jgi:hypothetical protein
MDAEATEMLKEPEVDPTDIMDAEAEVEVAAEPTGIMDAEATEMPKEPEVEVAAGRQVSSRGALRAAKPSVAPEERDDRWEKTARLLMLNPIAKLQEMGRTVRTIATNITANPAEAKFRTIKTTNSGVKSKLLDVTGGLDFLLAAGFKSTSDEKDVKVLQFPVELDESTTADMLRESASWLDSTIATCEVYASASASAGAAVCADCTIQVRLPTGSIVFGGFMRGDTLEAVRRYAGCYFSLAKSAGVQLRLPDVPGTLGEKQLQQELGQTDLGSRAVVFASLLSEEDKDLLISRKHNSSKEAEAKKVVTITQEKR